VIEIIYASAESQPFSSKQLTELLAKARQNNQALGVSGLLLYDRGSFLQVLEGEELAVSQLFDKIAKDKRHTRFVMIKRSTIKDRAFADWSMGFVEINAAMARKLDGFNAFLQQGVVATTGMADRMKKVLHGFRTGEWRQHVA
jgi:Sensors of blue-light using FAD